MQGRFLQSGRSAEGRQAGNGPGLPVKEADKGIDIDSADSTTREGVTTLARKAARFVPLERTCLPELSAGG
jgi:hypothetical protein